MLELDPQLQALLVAAVTFLVTEGLKALSNLIGFDLSGSASAIVAGVVALALAFVNGLLGFVPPEFHQVAQIIMALLVAILSSFGVHKTVKRFGK